jgi:D-amino-acid oxidase
MDVTVVGCGIIGLSAAIRLQEGGFSPRIVARELPPDTTSAVAAAIWYPYRAAPQHRVLPWSKRTLDVLYEHAAVPGTGVSIRRLYEFFDHPRPDPWWQDAVRFFRRMTAEELRPGYVDGFALEAPLVETPVYLRHLVQRFKAGGGRIDLVPGGLESLEALYAPGRLVVNCSGLGARTLAGDGALYPIRGQVVRVANPGLTDALIEEFGPLAMTYIIPRSHDCILGGTAQQGDWNRTPDPETAATILRHACTLEPRLCGAEVLEHRVGLRPSLDAAEFWAIYTALESPAS